MKRNRTRRRRSRRTHPTLYDRALYGYGTAFVDKDGCESFMWGYTHGSLPELVRRADHGQALMPEANHVVFRLSQQKRDVTLHDRVVYWAMPQLDKD